MQQSKPSGVSICLGAGDPSTDLLSAISARDLVSFVSLAEEPNNQNLNRVYPPPDSCSVLELACELDLIEYVNAVLANPETDVNLWNPHRQQAPIHVAAHNGNYKVLQALIDRGVNINAKNKKGRTALHLVTFRYTCDWMNGDSQAPKDETREKFRKSLQVLLSHPGTDLDMLDDKGFTSLHLACVKGAAEAVKKLIERGANMLKFCTERNKTALDLMETSMPELWEEYRNLGKEEQEEKINLSERDPTTELWETLQLQDEKQFRVILHKDPDVNVFHSGGMTCLLKACDSGLAPFVKLLISHKAKVDLENRNNQWHAIHYAAAHGNYELLKYLVEAGAYVNATTSFNLTALHLLLRRDDFQRKDYSNYDKCLEYLVAVSGLDPSVGDDLGNTPLHYAAINGSAENILLLLKHGADFAKKNKYEESAIDRIPPEVMERFFDFYVNKEDPKSTKDDKEPVITFDYSRLFPAEKSSDVEENRENSLKALQDQPSSNPETQTLWHMSRLESHRHLLKHPLIASFLQLKWQKCARYYYMNLGFFAVFVALITTYVLLVPATYSSQPTTEMSETSGPPKIPEATQESGDGSVAGIHVLRVILVLLNTICAIRELFQFILAPVRYMFSLENLAEWLTILTLYVVLFDLGSKDVIQGWAAVTLLLAWAELVLLVGRHRKFSLNVTVFIQVSWEFLYLFLWYFSLLLGFAFTFYTLFGVDVDEFSSIGKALMKSIVMMTGEFDYGGIPIHTHPFTGGCLFILFVFFITIVLLNLLVGLAVSETQEIRQKSEVVCQKSQLDLISYIEAMFFGDPYNYLTDYPAFKWIRHFMPCKWIRPHFSQFTQVLEKFGRSVLLFHRCLPRKKISVRLRPRKACVVRTEDNTRLELSDSVIRSATLLVYEKQRKNFDVQERMDQLELQLHRLNEKTDQIFSALQKMVS